MSIVWLMSNPSEASDDWIISPQIKLEAGCHYNLRMILQGSQYLENQRFEIRMGKGNTPEQMETVLISPTDFNYACILNKLLSPAETGEYHIGLHVITPAVNGAIAISHFSVGSPIRGAAPNVAANLLIQAAEKGGKSASIRFDAPKRTFDGDPIDALTKIVVKNITTGRTVKEFENPTPGQELTTTDDQPAEGNNTYAVISSNAAGDGPAAEASAWVGLDSASAPANVSWQQNGNEATLTWSAPTTGAHRGYVDPEGFTYKIIDNTTKETVKENIEGLTATLTPELDESTPQISLSYSVVAVNAAGEGSPGKSNTSAFGRGYEAPFAESFELARPHTSPWIIENVEGVNYFMPATDILGLPIRSYDDEGMMVYAPFQAGVTRLCLPILNLSKINNPALKIYVYYMDSNSKFSVVASHDSGNTWQEVAAAADNSIHNSWHMASFDLSALKGETDARIALQATSGAQGLYVCMDKFVIEDNLAKDLMVTDLAMPSKIQAGKSFVVSVNAVNNGYETTGDYEVEFTVNGVSAKSVAGTGLAPSAFREIKVELPLPATAAGINLEVNAHYAADENNDNNKLTGTTEVLRSRFPVPTGLTNESQVPEVAELTWEAPLTSYNATITDNLESYEPGSIGGIEVIGNLATQTIEVKNAVGQIGDYKLIDNDSLMTSYVYGVVGYGVPYLGQGMVCQVFDMERYPIQSSIWAAHSGNRMFCFWQALDPTLESATAVANDDYLILPELSEDDTRISFWAKSLTSKYNLASFEIMVSFTGTELEDFYPFQSVKDVPAEYAAAAESGYTFYEFDLPEGTKYAAIRHNSFDSMAMLVDDITFTPANNEHELTLVGYNVYRNDVKLNAEPVSECKFHDAPAEKGDYTYNVSAVFAEGESRYSNGVDLKVLSGIEAATTAKGRIYTAGHKIVVEGHEGEGIEVFTADGRKVASVTAKAVTSIEAGNGIYIVKAGSSAVAVAVK